MNHDLQIGDPQLGVGWLLSKSEGSSKCSQSLTYRDAEGAIKSQKDLRSNLALPLISYEALVEGNDRSTICDTQTHAVVPRTEGRVEHLAYGPWTDLVHAAGAINDTVSLLTIRVFVEQNTFQKANSKVFPKATK